MKNIILYILLYTMIGCSFGQGNPNTTLQKKPVIICPDKEDCTGADFRLSITNISENDTARLYTAISSTSKSDVGLLISVSKVSADDKGFGKYIVLKSIGKESDNLLHFISTLYKQKLLRGANFATSIPTTYVNLGDFAKAVAGKKDKASLVMDEYKLFFESKDDEAELFLNINQKDGWIDFREKDPEYRAPIIKMLSK